MRNKKFVLIMVLTFGMALIGIHAQSANQASGLVDTWANSNGGLTIAFSADGAGFSVAQAQRNYHVVLVWEKTFRGMVRRGEGISNIIASSASEAEAIARRNFLAANPARDGWRVISVTATPRR